ncbi:YobH family protein, partial [Escherichia coli]|nr:YobH family protein [Escherichia coli]
TYLTARGTSTVQYLHTKSGFLGITDFGLNEVQFCLCVAFSVKKS